MAFLSDADMSRALEAGSVKIAVLMEAFFESRTERVFTGVGKLVTRDGLEWTGLGEFVSISGLRQGVGLSANKATVTISGANPDWVKMAIRNEHEAKGRDIVIYGHLFTADNAPIGDRFAFNSGIMSNLKLSGNGPNKRTIEVPIEGLFTRRRRPVFGWNTDFDQRMRFPGDKGMEFTTEVVGKTVTWPDY